MKVCNECEKRGRIIQFSNENDLKKHMLVFHKPKYMEMRQLKEENEKLVKMAANRNIIEEKYEEYYGGNRNARF